MYDAADNGYSDKSDLYNEKKSLERNDYIYITTIIIIIIVAEIILIKYTNQIGYLGENLSIN